MHLVWLDTFGFLAAKHHAWPEGSCTADWGCTFLDQFPGPRKSQGTPANPCDDGQHFRLCLAACSLLSTGTALLYVNTC